MKAAQQIADNINSINNSNNKYDIDDDKDIVVAKERLVT